MTSPWDISYPGQRADFIDEMDVSAANASFQQTFASNYADNFVEVFTTPLNIVMQSTQATAAWYSGVSPFHRTLASAYLFEFVTGAAVIAAIVTLWDVDDTWKRDSGFHGVFQTKTAGIYGGEPHSKTPSRGYSPRADVMGWPYDQY
jgi:hypothetical protein